MMDLIIWRVVFGFGLKLIVENMEMTEMAETLDGIGQFPVPRVGPRHSTNKKTEDKKQRRKTLPPRGGGKHTACNTIISRTQLMLGISNQVPAKL